MLLSVIFSIKIGKRTYYFFNDIINIKNFDSSLLKIDKKSYRNIGIYNIGYIAINGIDDYENINNLNTLFLMIGETIGHIEKKHGSNNAFFNSLDENKEELEK